MSQSPPRKTATMPTARLIQPREQRWFGATVGPGDGDILAGLGKDDGLLDRFAFCDAGKLGGGAAFGGGLDGGHLADVFTALEARFGDGDRETVGLVRAPDGIGGPLSDIEGRRFGRGGRFLGSGGLGGFRIVRATGERGRERQGEKGGPAYGHVGNLPFF
jgi:hypothetical protein